MSKSDTTPDAPVNLAAERVRLTRLARAQADELEAENAQMRGELIPMAELHLTLAPGIERVRAKMLAGLLGVVPDLIAAQTVVEAETIMEGALRGALDELAAVEAEFADGGPQAA
jgi:phage terminase Nu1 subunit (DNA packaging protein)